jgi:hypothetical protein
MSYTQYLTTYSYPAKIRLGNKGDGGYVIADLSGSYDCYISAGVNNEESFSRDFIRHAQMDLANSYAFDGTIDGYPYNYTADIHFVRKNISGENTATTTNLKYLIQKYNDIFLKMDIEGGEYPWLASLSADDLAHFRQIVLEIHCPGNDEFGSTRDVKHACLKALANSHYIVHAHANNNGTGWGQNREHPEGVPTILELTYIRKDCVASEPPLNRVAFPIEGLDYKNAPYSDMSLTRPPFCFRD